MEYIMPNIVHIFSFTQSKQCSEPMSTAILNRSRVALLAITKKNKSSYKSITMHPMLSSAAVVGIGHAAPNKSAGLIEGHWNYWDYYWGDNLTSQKGGTAFSIS